MLVLLLCGAARFGRLALPCLAATVACPLLQPAELLRAASVTNLPLRAEAFFLLVSYSALARAANSSSILRLGCGAICESLLRIQSSKLLQTFFKQNIPTGQSLCRKLRPL